MSIFSAIAAFKGAFLGALFGNNSPFKGPEAMMPQVPLFPSKPGFGHAQPLRPVHGHSLPERPGYGHSHPSPVCQYPMTDRPVFLMNR